MKCFDEAEELGKRVLDARAEALGDNHPETLVSMSNLAMVYNSQGRREEAGDLMAEVIRRQSSSRQLGENHLVLTANPRTKNALTDNSLRLRRPTDY